jgi:biotin carboxyl carrier protein
MKKFLIKVNGTQYEVEVEEVKSEGIDTKAVESARTVSAPAAPAAPVSKSAAKTADVPAGSVTITSPMPGTILNVNVKAGDTVKKGQVLLILEAMKMENEIVAPADGKISSVNVSKSSVVSVGDVLISLG